MLVAGLWGAAAFCAIFGLISGIENVVTAGQRSPIAPYLFNAATGILVAFAVYVQRGVP